MSPFGIKYMGSPYDLNTKISINPYTNVAIKPSATFQKSLYLKSVNFNTIKVIDVVKSNACVKIEYQLSNSKY